MQWMREIIEAKKYWEREREREKREREREERERERRERERQNEEWERDFCIGDAERKLRMKRVLSCVLGTAIDAKWDRD